MKSQAAAPKFVFTGIGTKGDVFPLAALAQEMLRRGYQAHLLANAGYEALAASHGVGFTPVTIAQTNNLMSASENLTQHVFPSYDPTIEYLRQQVDQGQSLVVVNLDEFSASNMLCERYELPLCRIHLTPHRIRSLIRPPWPHRQHLEGRLGSTYRKYRLPYIYAQMSKAPPFMAGLNRFRHRVGLAPVVTLGEIDAAVTTRVGFFPSWYAEPAPDWPSGCKLVGFPLSPTSASPPSGLAEFVRREGKPVVFTPGTGVVDVERFFEDARQCCEVLDMPGVFLSPHFRAPNTGVGSRMLHFDFLDLELVLRHAALLVHHGGIGTTARALAAAVPQIIRPRAYDQFDNGDRVSSLGVGQCLLPKKYSLERLTAAARELTSGAGVKQKLEQVAGRIRAQDAVARAADVLERVARAKVRLPTELACATSRPRQVSLSRTKAGVPRSRRTKFILSSLGTEGDLLPLLALAKELTDRGHACHLLGNAACDTRATQLGIEFSAIAPAQTNNLTSKEERFRTYNLPSHEPTFGIFERELALGNRLVVVNRGPYSASTLMCERYGLPRIQLFLAPAHIRSLDAPPAPWKARACGQLGKAFKKYHLPKIYAAVDENPYILWHVNAQRRSLGLGQITSLHEYERLVDHSLGFFPEWYATPASDWPAIDLVGFPTQPSFEPLPARLTRFLDTHERPLVFTPGTGVRDVGKFFAEARRCCDLLDRPGVLLSPHHTPAGLELGDRVLHFDFVELGSLLPRAALLVHHGGIGTTARAIEAGIPQIISPQSFDQPDNGGRVSDLGVGAVLARTQLTGETLAATARALLQSELVATTLRTLARRIPGTPAIPLAADILIERFANLGAPARPRAAELRN
ncbi:MAG: nucleotide disphospho-sugar-binding domain-containing protein [Deltaproteobacteria bacterium]